MPKHRRYPWPASLLTDPVLMSQLHQVSKATKRPITKLIREATVKLVAELRDKMDAPELLRKSA